MKITERIFYAALIVLVAWTPAFSASRGTPRHRLSYESICGNGRQVFRSCDDLSVLRAVAACAHHQNQAVAKNRNKKMPFSTGYNCGKWAPEGERKYMSTRAYLTAAWTGGGVFKPCTNRRVFVSLTPGLHTFQVKLRIVAGNTEPTPASYAWTIQWRFLSFKGFLSFDVIRPATLLCVNPI